MLKLLRREIEDNIIYFILPVCFAVVSITIVVVGVLDETAYDLPVGVPVPMYRIFYVYVLFGGFVAAAFGASQMSPNFAASE